MSTNRTDCIPNLEIHSKDCAIPYTLFTFEKKEIKYQFIENNYQKESKKRGKPKDNCCPVLLL